MNNLRSLPDLLARTVSLYPDKSALFYKKRGRYRPISYADFLNKVHYSASGLSALGIQFGDRVAILSQNRPEWVIADFAILTLGAVSVPLYPTLSQPEWVYLLKNCQAKAIVVDTPEHAQALWDIWSQCQQLEVVIVLCNCRVPAQYSEKVVSFDSLTSTGKARLHHFYANPQTRPIDRQTLASIVYTSGTTGQPKGVMLTHGNFLSNVESLLAVTPVTSQDVVLSFLPLSHVFERTVGYYTLVAVGGSIYYAQSIQSVPEDLMLARPTVLVSVPRVYEKMYSKIMDQLSGVRKWMFCWALKVGNQALKNKGKSTSFLFKLKQMIADQLVFKKIRQTTGGRLRFFVSGGAPLSKELGQFFEKVGLLIIEGYGMTETSPVIACNRVGQYRFGTVGLPLPGVDTKVASDGELLVKGPSVMAGYWQSSDQSADVVDDQGWLHTGDIVSCDEAGFISIVDRKKELIVLSNGKKVAPQMVEKKLQTSPYIAQAIVIGDNRPYLVALIVPDHHRLKQKFGPLMSHQDWHLHSDVVAFIQRIVQQKCYEFAPFEQVKKVVLLSQDLSTQPGLLTPTLKPKRKAIAKAFLKSIESLYSE